MPHRLIAFLIASLAPLADASQQTPPPPTDPPPTQESETQESETQDTGTGAQDTGAPDTEPGTPDVGTQETIGLDAEAVATRLQAAQAELEGAPPDPEAGSPEAEQRTVLQQRVELLQEATALFQRLQEQATNRDQLGARQQAVEARLAEAPAEVRPPRSPETAEFEELERELAAQRARVTQLSELESDRDAALERLPAERGDARQRADDSDEREARLRGEASDASDPAQSTTLQMRADNASLEHQVARLQVQVLDGRRDLEQALSPIRAAEKELAERELERLEESYQVYGEALAAALEEESDRLAEEIEEREAELEATSAPEEAFPLSKRLDMLRSQRNQQGDASRLLALRTDLEEQLRRLGVESEELRNLQEYLERAGTGPATADRIQFTLRRVKLRRQALKRTLQRDLTDELSAPRARRFELEDRLFFLRDTWKEEVDAAAAQLSEREARSFRSAARALYEEYRSTLRTESDGLTELIGVGQDLQVALIDRRKGLDELESFIRSKVFWLRDGKPLGPELLKRVPAELGAVRRWVSELTSPSTRARLSESLSSLRLIAGALFVLGLAPMALFFARQRLRRAVTRLNDRTLEHDAPMSQRILAVLLGVVSVSLLPAYLYFVSRMTRIAELPEFLAPILVTLLEASAFFLFFHFLSRSFFSGRGTAQVQFGMDRDAAHGLHAALRLGLFGYVVFWTLRTILSRAPFALDGQALEALPRISGSIYLAFATVATCALFRPRSTFSRALGRALGDNLLGRRWTAIGVMLCIAAVAIFVLDALGYRYSSGVLFAALLQSVLALLLLVAAYQGLSAVFEAYARRREAAEEEEEAARRAASPETTDRGELPAVEEAADDSEEEDDGNDEESQVKKLFRVLFVAGGAVLIANLWGLDTQAFETLDRMKAYDMRDTGDYDEFVSWGDVLRTAFYLMGTSLLLRYLPGIYEYAVFPRFNIDAGLKYAILTISRYGVFTIGLILALSEIHLDLGRLSWLMAAVGVGLGFGLQEIVSNFVSGIILLVERPVRVGDVVTVGNTSGRVQRINIRATSVVNFDRQEIIVPNRSLITKEVTNWTRGDTILRLVVPVGVAYGTDVDQVTELLLEIASGQSDILEDPGPQALFLAHGDSSLDFELRVFVPDPGVKLGLQHRLNREINRRFEAAGIEIPFPQRDLHIRSSAVSLPSLREAESS